MKHQVSHDPELEKIILINEVVDQVASLIVVALYAAVKEQHVSEKLACARLGRGHERFEKRNCCSNMLTHKIYLVLVHLTVW